MAYIVLAAGAVMVVIGALAIVTGYPIIQVERGWTTVIAGTSLLTGGIVTMALALVLRALFDLRHAMMRPEAAAAALANEARALPTRRTEDPRLETRTEPTTGDAVAPSLNRDAALLSAVTAVPTVAVALHHAAETHEMAEPLHDLEPRAHQHPVADNETPQDGSHDHAANEEAAPRLDDWLDRAFADLHEPPAVVHGTAASTQAEPQPLYADHHHDAHPVEVAEAAIAPTTQLHDDHVALPSDTYEPHHHEHPHEAYADAMEHAHAEVAPAALEPSEPTSAVIGRYEADGTSYTMYADGSIEAQSDAGLYRFASMTELKAFIEG